MIARGIIRLLKYVQDHSDFRKPKAENVRHILLVETTRFGDLIAAMSSYQRFATTFPNATITILLHEDHVSVMPALGVNVRCITLPWPRDLYGCIEALLDLHERRFDLACSMSPSAKNSFLALFAPADLHTGYLEGDASLTPHRSALALDSSPPVLERIIVPVNTNIYDRSGAVADQLGCVISDAMIVPLPEYVTKEWPTLVSRLKVDPRRPIVVIHPFAGWKFREWHLQHVRAFVEILRDACPDVQVVVLGKEKDFIAGVRAVLRFLKGVHVLGSDDWLVSALLISHCTVFIGTDSGPLHLAAALGVRVLGLYGPAAPAATAPPERGGRRRTLYYRLNCSPCDQRTCVAPNAPCMTGITPSAVFEAVAPFILKTKVPVANA